MPSRPKQASGDDPANPMQQGAGNESLDSGQQDSDGQRTDDEQQSSDEDHVDSEQHGSRDEHEDDHDDAIFGEEEPDKIQVLKDKLAGVLHQKQIEKTLLTGINAMKYMKVCILDPAPATPAFEEVRSIKSNVLQKQNLVKDVFAAVTTAEVTDLTFPVGSTPSAIQTYFKENLKDIEDDEILVVYFCGNAGGNGGKYTWKMNGIMRGKVNAYDIIQTCIDSGKDVIFILDCYIPDRFRNRWKLPTEGKVGNVEIIARGERLNRSDGTVNHDDPGDFSQNLFHKMLVFAKSISKRPDKKAGFKNWHAPCSLTRLLAYEKIMSANPRRLWLSRTKYGDRKVVTRFVLLPDHIRATGQIFFFVKQIQGPLSAGLMKQLANEESIEVAEGFDFGE